MNTKRPRPGRFPGKTERSLALVILLTGVVPLIAALLLVREVLDHAWSVWTNPALSPQLERTVALYKDYVRVVKEDMGHQMDAIAADPELRDALVLKKGAPPLAHAVEELLVHYPDLVSLAVEDDSGQVLLARDRGRPLDAANERSRELRRTLRDALPSPTVVATFSFQRRYEQDLEHVGKLRDAYEAFQGNRANVYASYYHSFAALLIFTVVVTVVIGFLIARGVTRRINRLAHALDQVAQGSFDVRVPETGSDELTDLARVFNRMLEEMQQSRARIEYLQRVGAWQEMARRLAHEIKNPLTPIQLAVQQCHRKYDGDDKAYRALLDTTAEIVEEEVGTLRRLVTNFSNFARLPHPELVEADVGDFLRECREQAQTLGEVSSEGDEGDSLGTHNVGIEWAIEPGALRAAFDRQLLRRVLINLVRNGVQATQTTHSSRDGGAAGRVRIGAAQSPQGVVLTFEDDGPGVPEAMRERIFDPYVTTKEDGTGLGLAIVKKVVVEHGGTIEVGESEALGGARFVVRLPLPHAVAKEA